MNRSLTWCQFVAFGAGVLACLALVGISILLRPMYEMLYRGGGKQAFYVQLAVMTLVPVAIACGVAIYSRPHRLVVFITTLVPALMGFLAGYLFDISTLVIDSARHAMSGGVLGYVYPLNIVGQVFKAGPFLLWAIVAGVMGLALKRALVGRETEQRIESREYYSFFRFLGGLVILALVGVIVFWSVQVARNTPDARVAAAKRILDSPKSSDALRMYSIMDLHGLRSEAASKVLQEAASKQSYPLNVVASGLLAERNDISALPLLESQMMKSSRLKGDHFDMRLGMMLDGIKDPAAVPTLVRLMKSDDPETREGAAQALRNIGIPAIKALIAGLDDPDWKVRWISVLGLAEAVKTSPGEKDWGPADEEFKRNEQMYLEHWKAWAARWDGRE